MLLKQRVYQGIYRQLYGGRQGSYHHTFAYKSFNFVS